MTAVGFLLVGFGVLTVWSGFDQVIVFDLLRAFVGGTPGQRTKEGAPLTPSSAGAMVTVAGGGSNPPGPSPAPAPSPSSPPAGGGGWA